METIGSDAIQMELKYCERCGGLWLRVTGSEVVYCPACSMILAGIARDPRSLEGRGNRASGSTAEDFERSFWGEGGRA
ncbi:MAG TPA: hypothetical protein VJO35_01820 [Terriglobales bacterium]|nr:hypothetical protein [Terriglobales bacterium]